MERHVGLSGFRARGCVRLVAHTVSWAVLPVAVACAAQGAEVVAYRVVGDGIPVALTAVPGDSSRGRVAALNSRQGNCAICHRLPVADVAAFGDVGPSLEGVGGRLSVAQLRLRIVDARRSNPDSAMPAYHKVDGLFRVAAGYRNRPLLSAQEIEDIVAWLTTLK
jgi:sulfur-oxidizing protein SoxX